MDLIRPFYCDSDSRNSVIVNVARMERNGAFEGMTAAESSNLQFEGWMRDG